jgi:hypothetical protein
MIRKPLCFQVFPLCVRDSSGNFFAPKGKKIAANSPTRRETPKNSAINLKNAVFILETFRFNCARKSLLGIYNLSKKRAFLAATLLDFSP